jgi:hypothetical protein
MRVRVRVKVRVDNVNLAKSARSGALTIKLCFSSSFAVGLSAGSLRRQRPFLCGEGEGSGFRVQGSGFRVQGSLSCLLSAV